MTEKTITDGPFGHEWRHTHWADGGTHAHPAAEDCDLDKKPGAGTRWSHKHAGQGDYPFFHDAGTSCTLNVAGATMASGNDPVDHPAHYLAHPSGVECITIVQWMGFNLGNVVKYVWRADLKGDAIEDLKKARRYLDYEIERLESKP